MSSYLFCRFCRFSLKDLSLKDPIMAVNPTQVYKDATAQTKRSPLPFCCWKIPVKWGFALSGRNSQLFSPGLPLGVIIFSEFIAAIAVGHAVGIVVCVLSVLFLLLAVAIVRHMFRHPEALPQESTPLKYERKRLIVMNLANASKLLCHLVVPFFTVYCLVLLIVRLTSTSAPSWGTFPSECPASQQDGCSRIGPPQNRCGGCTMPCSTKPGSTHKGARLQESGGPIYLMISISHSKSKMILMTSLDSWILPLIGSTQCVRDGPLS